MIGDPAALARLNAVVWPLMSERRQAFVRDARAAGAEFAILDVPLLLETGGADIVDAVVVVSAPAALQRARVLARPGMDASKLQALLAAQMSDAEKRARADFVIETSGGKDDARRQVRAVIAALRRGRDTRQGERHA